VQKLAQILGGPLYVREGRQLEMTALGLSAVALAERLDGHLQDFAAQLRAGDAVEPLVLAAGSGAHRWVIGGAVRWLLAGGEHVRLLTTDADATVAAVRDGRATVGVTVLGSRPKGLDRQDLATYGQVALIPMGHALARHRKLRLADLDGVPLVLAPPGRPQRRAFERHAQGAGLRLDVVAEAEGWDQMLHFVAIGAGVCVANGCVQAVPGVVARPVEDLPPITYSTLSRPADRRTPPLVRLLGALRAGTP
jgi:DNA-binding transcriptional LysR family regulator